MAGNFTFFAKAAQQKITWKDIFSDVFKKHTLQDGERLFMAGTTLTTPHESRMLSEWKKPWLFAYVGIFGLVFIAIMFALHFVETRSTVYQIPLVFVGSLVAPLAVLLLMWEMNIPRNIPLYMVLAMFFAGGGLSLIITFVLHGFLGPVEGAITEEPAKLIALCLFLRDPKYKYTLNGVLIGAAVGAGFAAIETMDYAFFRTGSIMNLLTRGLLSPGGHVVWAALYGGALVMVKGSERLNREHFKNKEFLTCFGIAVVLHLIWNAPFGLMPLPFFGDMKYIMLIAAAWAALLRIIKLGVLQVMQIPQTDGILPFDELQETLEHSVPKAAVLHGLSGMYSGGVFPLSGSRLVFGRDTKQANIIFPPTAPGISSVHCDITTRGESFILTDLNSRYGTFWADGTRLTPGKPYPLPPRQRFYLANRENLFEIE